MMGGRPPLLLGGPTKTGTDRKETPMMVAFPCRRAVRATARSLVIAVLPLGVLLAPTSVGAQEATPAGDGTSPTAGVTADGSGTLGPVLAAAAEAFAEQAPEVEVAIEQSSSGQGLKRF